MRDDAAFADAAASDLKSAGMRTVVALDSMAGLARARMIRNKRPHLPTILMSAYSEPLEGEVALAGAVLCKPFELAEFCREIRAR
jgi:CheY-like chemotaxis protein